MLKIIHGADFHLDSPFTGLTPERAAQRREEQRELLDRLGQLARERQADLVLLSGDLLDSGRVFQETAEALVRTLAQIPCPVFLAPGNHDYWSDRSVYATLDWPDHVHIFHTAAPERVDLPQLNCAVWGSAFLAPHQTESPFAGLRVPRDGRVHLGCFHGDMNPQSHYGPVTREEVAASGLHYLALGHIHQGSGLQREGDTFWAYSGCPEGRNFGETGEKGVLYVEVEPGQATAQLLPTAHRRYEILSVDLTGADDPLSAIRSALPGDAGEHIFRILLTGEGPRPDLPALERALAPACYWITLRDQTRLPQDLWARREEDTLTGLFLQSMWEQCQQHPDDPLYQLAARYGLAALERGEEGTL